MKANIYKIFAVFVIGIVFGLLPLIFPLLHVAYGVGTLVGLLQIPFWRRKIKNSHAKEHIEKVKRKIKENTRK